MQREPLGRLLITFVVKLVVDGAGAERFEQIAPDIFGELTAVDENIRAGHAAKANSIRREKAIRFLFSRGGSGRAATEA